MGVSDIYSEYLESMAYSPATQQMRLRLLRRLGDPAAADRRDIERVVSTPKSPHSRQVYLSQLRSIYRDLMFLGIVDNDPTRGMRVASTPQPPPRPYSDEEVRILLGLPDPVRSWAVVGLFAGLRAAECTALTTGSLQADGVHVVGKGRKAAVVPAHPLVVEVLQSWQPVGMPSGEMSRRFRWSAECAGVAAPAAYHRCRHTFATRLLAATGDLLLVRDALRHSSVATTQRYTALADGRVRNAVTALAA